MWREKDNSLYRKFEFDSFEEAIRFIYRIAKIAAKLDHHPKITNVYNTVELWLSTHSAGDKVTAKDSQLANEIDKLMDRKNTQIKLYTDGGSRGNPGPSGIGVVICDLDDNVVKKYGKYIGQSTNNQAEYRALIDGLKSCEEIGANKVEVLMDSELIVRQLNGQYKVKNSDIKPLFERVRDIEGKFDQVSYTHVPRDKNKLADELVNQALDAK